MIILIQIETDERRDSARLGSALTAYLATFAAVSATESARSFERLDRSGSVFIELQEFSVELGREVPRSELTTAVRKFVREVLKRSKQDARFAILLEASTTSA